MKQSQQGERGGSEVLEGAAAQVQARLVEEERRRVSAEKELAASRKAASEQDKKIQTLKHYCAMNQKERTALRTIMEVRPPLACPVSAPALPPPPTVPECVSDGAYGCDDGGRGGGGGGGGGGKLARRVHIKGLGGVVSAAAQDAAPGQTGGPPGALASPPLA